MSDKKINLTDLTVNDMNIIMAGLGKLPLDVVFEVFTRIKAQAEEQLSKDNE